MKEYIKTIKNLPGVYRIINLENNKTYIGSAINIRVRLFKHLWCLNNDMHPNIHLQRSYNKNKNIFKCDVLLYTEVEEIRTKEQQYIDQYKPEYNLRNYVDNLTVLSDETIYKLSEAAKRQHRSNRIKNNSPKIGVYDLDGQLLKIFDTQVEASKYIGISTSTVWSDIKNKSVILNKFFVIKSHVLPQKVEAKEVPVKFEYCSHFRKPIKVIKGNNLIGTFCSVSEAARQLKIRRGNIVNWLNGNNKSSQGYTIEAI